MSKMLAKNAKKKKNDFKILAHPYVSEKSNTRQNWQTSQVSLESIHEKQAKYKSMYDEHHMELLIIKF